MLKRISHSLRIPPAMGILYTKIILFAYKIMHESYGIELYILHKTQKPRTHPEKAGTRFHYGQSTSFSS